MDNTREEEVVRRVMHFTVATSTQPTHLLLYKLGMMYACNHRHKCPPPLLQLPPPPPSSPPPLLATPRANYEAIAHILPSLWQRFPRVFPLSVTLDSFSGFT